MSNTIIDFHAHIASPAVFPEPFRRGIVDNLLVALHSRGTPLGRPQTEQMLLATLTDPMGDSLVAEMDAAGIATSVLLIPDFSYIWPQDSATVQDQLDHHLAVTQRHPGRFVVFPGVDPRWGQDGVALFERSIVEYGFHGLKIYPPCGYGISNAQLYPFFEVCRSYGVPVLTHMGASSPTLDFEIAVPIGLDRAAKDFPEVDFIMAHGAVHYPDEGAMLCNNRPNVYMDVSGYQMPGGLDNLARLFGRGIVHKLLFATDYPIFRLQGRQADFVERVLTSPFLADARRGDADLFLSGNAHRILAKRTVPPTV